MFKFNFSSDNSVNSNEKTSDETVVKWLESYEIKPKDTTKFDSCNTNIIKCGDISVKYLSSEEIIDVLREDESSVTNSVLSAEQNHSDLITAVYEGGIKIWECTYDLLNFITNSCFEFNDKDVLDLGCGAGLVGILACCKGANACFQDYNPEVISNITILNVVANKIPIEKQKFYCGDWQSFVDKLKQEKFDFIFTSETIYNPDNYKKLINVFKNLLRKDGTIYLAAKHYYFGVGGGISQFQDTLKMEDIFTYSTVWECQEGVKRAIIKINFK